MRETHNLWINEDLREEFGLQSNPLLPKLCRRHPKLRLDTFECEVVRLLIEFFQKLCVCIQAIELSKVNLESSEKGLPRPATPGR